MQAHRHRFGDPPTSSTWQPARHFGPAQLAMAERAFARWGMVTVVVGRFIAILRIFVGPLAGVLGMPYRRFLAANGLGGVLWTVGTTTAVYFLASSPSSG